MGGPISCTGGPLPVCTPKSGIGTGIPGTGVGLDVRAEVTELRIHFKIVHRNGGFGIFSNGSAGNAVVTGNVSSSNGVSGISVGPRSLVAHNPASGNLGGHGISVGDGSTITGKPASDNDARGVSTGTGCRQPVLT